MPALQSMFQTTFAPLVAGLAPQAPAVASAPIVPAPSIKTFLKESIRLSDDESSRLGALMGFDDDGLDSTSVMVIAEIFKYEDLKADMVKAVRPFFSDADKTAKWLYFQARLNTLSQQIK